MTQTGSGFPMGFGMALIQNERAATNFYALSAWKKEEILRRLHNISSKEEMRALTAKLADGEIPYCLR